MINPWSLWYSITLSTSFWKHCGLHWCLLRISLCSLFLGGLNPSPPLHPPPPPSWLPYIFLYPCLPLINYKVSINKREQLFTCSAISLAKAIFILRPFIYHHSTLVRLEPLLAVARAVPINIMDLWVDVFLSTFNNAVIYILICHFLVLQAAWRDP